MNNNYISCPICKNIFLKTHIKIHFQICKKKSGQYMNSIQKENITNLRNINNSNKNINDKNNILNNNIVNQSSSKNILNQSSSKNMIEKNNIVNQSYSKNINDKNNILNNNIVNQPSNKNIVNQPSNKNMIEKNNDINNDTIIFNSNDIKQMQLENYIRPELVNYSDNVLNYFFSEYNKLFYKYVEGKTISLVGPAQSIIGTGKGDIIDKFDIVVRLNKSIPLPSNIKNDIGSKSDIIYNSLNTSDFPGENNLNPSLYKKYGVKFVCSSYPFNHNIFHDDILNYIYKYKFELPLKVMNDLKFRNFEKSLGTRPYTGTCAIMDLLSYPIKYLYITGLDFYQTKYYSEYRRISKGTLKYNKNNIIHQCNPQIDYLKNISLFDNRVILDNFLDKLLYHDYYKVFKNLNLFDKNEIFNFGDIYFQKYFEMKVSLCTFTKNDININNIDNSKSYLIFTDNKYFKKNGNEYCMFVTNEKNILAILNGNLNSKRFIGNFYYAENKHNQPTIYMTLKFLGNLKSTLVKIGINNCNINLAILLSLVLYLPDNHYFSYNEIFNKWNLSTEEKKFVLFLIKKKILKLVMQ